MCLVAIMISCIQLSCYLQSHRGISQSNDRKASILTKNYRCHILTCAYKIYFVSSESYGGSTCLNVESGLAYFILRKFNRNNNKARLVANSLVTVVYNDASEPVSRVFDMQFAECVASESLIAEIEVSIKITDFQFLIFGSRFEAKFFCKMEYISFVNC